MCKEQKSGTWGTVECAMDVLTTFWYKNQSKYMYNSAYHINDDNWSMCCTSLQLSSRIFWILVKFHSNSCRCSDTWLTDWTVRTYSDFGTEQLFYQQPVELFAVHQINHFPVACCEHNLPHNLLGQWFIWWMVLLIQSSNSKYLRV